MIHSAEEFVRLRRSELPEEYNRAGSEEAPVEVWLAVLEQFPDLREWVALNKAVPISILERLARDSDPKVRATVASKRKLTEELQVLLAQDPDASVRERLACNAKCSTEIRRQLANDLELFVRSAAIERLQSS
jgi:hypothetical protein